MKINEVTREKGGNRYCGPAVISSIIGINTDEASRLIRKFSGKRSVRGSSTIHVLMAMKFCGVDVRTSNYPTLNGKRPTLTGWLKSTKSIRTAGRVFLVVAGNHFQLVSGRRFVCGLTKSVVSIKHEKVKRRARVAEVYELIAPNGISKPSQDVVGKPKRVVNPMTKAKRLAAKHGILVDQEYGFDREDDTFYVCHGKLIETDDDPHDWHYHHSRAEAAEAIEEIVDALTALGLEGNTHVF